MDFSRSRETRKVYLFEERFLSRKTRPIKMLRKLARRIWRENTRRRDRVPKVLAGRGVQYGKELRSFCEGRTKIVLARHQRTKAVLIHEIVHALGPVTHGKRFQRKFAELLWRYGE